jgi:hypothetical protein
MTSEQRGSVERMFEGAARAFGGRLHPLQVVERVVDAVGRRSVNGAVPNAVQVLLCPADYDAFEAALGDLEREVRAALHEAELRRGLRRIGELQLSFVRSNGAGPGELQVRSAFVDTANRPASLPSGVTRRLERLRGYGFLVDGTWTDLSHVPFRIGRASDNDLVLASLAVSRHHAEVARVDGEIRMIDLHSRNGLVVGDSLLYEVPIVNGVSILLGDILLTLVAP